MDFCCTCATALTAEPRRLRGERTTECCARTICASCIQSNARFATYCLYCQVSSAPSPLPQRLRDPPAYTSIPSTRASTADASTAPPPYTTTTCAAESPQKTGLGADSEKGVPDDTLHFLNHEHDSIASLSLRYGVPAPVLRRANNITSDHLLLGRRTILIPGQYYSSGISLSPRPVHGEEDELRKGKIRRFMTSCKVFDYDVALLYLEQSSYDLEAAVLSYFDDDAWERRHPRQRLGTATTPGRGPDRRNRLWRGL
ncbi:hypothetical protein CDD83_35 [Cordyceps sp. RAO-2017]|nr:hypothetical protein CDD83_35 [Cordyceps sp. RAO-2017]